MPNIPELTQAEVCAAAARPYLHYAGQIQTAEAAIALTAATKHWYTAPQEALQLGSPTLSVRSKLSKLPEINTQAVRIFS